MAKHTFPQYEYSPTAPEAIEFSSAPIIHLAIVRDSQVDAPKQITSPQHVYEALRQRFADADREVLVAILLDSKSKILAIDPVSVGALDSSIVSVRECFKSAMLLGAASIIFAHNHPSGDPTPSPEDVLATRRLIEAGRLLEINVLDHVVLGNNRFVSLQERRACQF